jgi:hypothetical protein
VAAVTATVNLPDLVESAVLVALTMTFVFVVTVGAVNRPVCAMEPPEADQLRVCGAPAGETVPEHWLVAPEFTGETQLTLTESTAGGGAA